MNPAISAILITKNEEKNIERCLRSLAWADEVVIVDSFSADKTVEIARKFSNVRLISSEWLGFSGTKRLAVQNSRNNWVFWIDADEEAPDELRDEIFDLVRNSPKFDAFDMPRKTFFLGEWVQHTGWYPGRVCRLFHKERADFNDNILHEGLKLNQPERLGHLRSDLLHFSYTSLRQYFQKMNDYGILGAEELLRRGKTFSVWNLVLNPLTAFFKFYVMNKGFLDGKTGLIISIGSAFSNFIKYTNLYYLSQKGRVPID